MAKNSYYGRVNIRKEAFNTLRTNIQFSSIDRDLKVMALTSSHSAEGKTTIALELGESFSNTGIKVLVINCDLRKPTMQELFEQQVTVGLTNVLLKKCSVEDAIFEENGTYYLMSGPLPPNPTELLGSQTMKNLIERLEQEFDLILIDTPPTGLFSDAAILSPVVDGYLLVCAENETRKDEMAHTIDSLERVDGNIIGVIMSMVESEGLTYGHYGKYGKYGKYGAYTKK